MLKNALGVIGGYVAMAVFVFATFSLTYLVLGTEGSFQPGSYEVTGFWLMSSIILSAIAAVFGGFVCGAISKNTTASKILAGIVLVLGLILAVPILMQSGRDQVKMREGTVSNFDAMKNGQQPPWVALLNPIIGAAGVMFGARMKLKKQTPDVE